MKSAILGLLGVLLHTHAGLAHLPLSDGKGEYYRAYLTILRKSDLRLPAGNSVAVIGEVEKPGEVLYGDGVTASKVIAAVGGIAQYGDHRRIGIWKEKNGQFIIFDLKALEEKTRDAPDPLLEGGDVVIVLERKFSLR